MAATGQASEVACFGTRGDGKTWGAFGCMLHHAVLHQRAGHPLPVKWLGAADTFASHTAKTHESLRAAGWGGVWRLEGDGHVAVAVINGVEAVRLRLLGVEDQAGLDRLRAESHGLWFEEPAPSSVGVQSTGLGEKAWNIGVTSCRLASHANPKILTTNYPTRSHWTWRRFVTEAEGHPERAYVRIPPGEYASAAQREEWRQALADDPSALLRLVEGEPASVYEGDRVASAFRWSQHVSQGPLQPSPHEGRLWIGQDGGLTPTSVIGQRQGGRIMIFAGLTSEDAGMRQHVEQVLRPWIGEHAPWALRAADAIRVEYDPSIDTDDQGDSETNALRVMRRLLPATYHPGPVDWLGRRDPMLAAFNAMVNGQPLVQIDPAASMLLEALDGGWYYPVKATGSRRSDQPKKPNHPAEDAGDSLCYMLAGMRPTKDERERSRGPLKISRTWDVLDHTRPELAQRRFTVRRSP